MCSNLLCIMGYKAVTPHMQRGGAWQWVAGTLCIREECTPMCSSWFFAALGQRAAPPEVQGGDMWKGGGASPEEGWGVCFRVFPSTFVMEMCSTRHKTVTLQVGVGSMRRWGGVHQGVYISTSWGLHKYMRGLHKYSLHENMMMLMEPNWPQASNPYWYYRLLWNLSVITTDCSGSTRHALQLPT